MIELDEQAPLHVRVRVPLDRFSLETDLVLARRATGLFGSSGAGKSTLLETIAGLRRNARGHLAFGDSVWLDDGRCVPPERRGIGYVPQDGLLFPHLSVRQNLLAGSARARHASGGRAADVEHVARLLELSDLLTRGVATLSGGERQRVALGRALCSAPRLLLLDEPFGALDLALRRRLLPLLERVVSEARVPVVLVSHDPSEIVALCDEVVVLRSGKPMAQGDPLTLLTDPDTLGGQVASYDNVLSGTVTTADDLLATVQVASAFSLVVRDHRLRAGDSVVVSLRAEDIIVGHRAPVGLSARNVVEGCIERIRGTRRRWLTVLLESGVRLVVELTARACNELDLREGGDVCLVFKATSCRIATPSR